MKKGSSAKSTEAMPATKSTLTPCDSKSAASGVSLGNDAVEDSYQTSCTGETVALGPTRDGKAAGHVTMNAGLDALLQDLDDLLRPSLTRAGRNGKATRMRSGVHFGAAEATEHNASVANGAAQLGLKNTTTEEEGEEKEEELDVNAAEEEEDDDNESARGAERLRRDFLFSFGRLNQYARSLRGGMSKLHHHSTTTTANAETSGAAGSKAARSSPAPPSLVATNAAGRTSPVKNGTAASLPDNTTTNAAAAMRAGHNSSSSSDQAALGDEGEEEVFLRGLLPPAGPAKKRRTDPNNNNNSLLLQDGGASESVGGDDSGRQQHSSRHQHRQRANGTREKGAGEEGNNNAGLKADDAALYHTDSDEIESTCSGAEASDKAGGGGRVMRPARGPGHSTTTPTLNARTASRVASLLDLLMSGNGRPNAASMSLMQSLLALLQQQQQAAASSQTAVATEKPNEKQQENNVDCDDAAAQAESATAQPPPLLPSSSSAEAAATMVNTSGTTSQMDCMRALLAAARQRTRQREANAEETTQEGHTGQTLRHANSNDADDNDFVEGHTALTLTPPHAQLQVPNHITGNDDEDDVTAMMSGVGGLSGLNLPADFTANLISLFADHNFGLAAHAAWDNDADDEGEGDALTRRSGNNNTTPPMETRSPAVECDGRSASATVPQMHSLQPPQKLSATTTMLGSDEATRKASQRRNNNNNSNSGLKESDALMPKGKAQSGATNDKHNNNSTGGGLLVVDEDDEEGDAVQPHTNESDATTRELAQHLNMEDLHMRMVCLSRLSPLLLEELARHAKKVDVPCDSLLEVMPLPVENPSCAVVAYRLREAATAAASMLWWYAETRDLHKAGLLRMTESVRQELRQRLGRLQHRIHHELRGLSGSRLQRVLQCMPAVTLNDAHDVCNAVSCAGAILFFIVMPLPLLQSVCKELALTTNEDGGTKVDRHTLAESLAERISSYLYPLPDGTPMTLSQLPFLPRFQVHEHAPGSFTCTVDNASNLGRMPQERLLSNHFSCSKVKWRAMLTTEDRKLGMHLWHRQAAAVEVYLLVRTSEPKKRKNNNNNSNGNGGKAGSRTGQQGATTAADNNSNSGAASALYLEKQCQAEPGELVGFTDFLDLAVAMCSTTAMNVGVRTYNMADDRLVFQLSMRVQSLGESAGQAVAANNDNSRQSTEENETGKTTPGAATRTNNRKKKAKSGAGDEGVEENNSTVTLLADGVTHTALPPLPPQSKNNNNKLSMKNGRETSQATTRAESGQRSSAPSTRTASAVTTNAGKEDDISSARLSQKQYEKLLARLESQEAAGRRELVEAWQKGLRQMQNEESRTGQRLRQRIEDRERKQLLAKAGPTQELIREVERLTQMVQSNRQVVNKLSKERAKDAKELERLKSRLAEGTQELTRLQDTLEMNTAVLGQLEEDVRRKQLHVAEKKKRVLRHEQRRSQEHWLDFKHALDDPIVSQHDTLAIDDLDTFMTSLQQGSAAPFHHSQQEDMDSVQRPDPLAPPGHEMPSSGMRLTASASPALSTSTPSSLVAERRTNAPWSTGPATPASSSALGNTNTAALMSNTGHNAGISTPQPGQSLPSHMSGRSPYSDSHFSHTPMPAATAGIIGCAPAVTTQSLTSYPSATPSTIGLPPPHPIPHHTSTSSGASGRDSNAGTTTTTSNAVFPARYGVTSSANNGYDNVAGPSSFGLGGGSGASGGNTLIFSTQPTVLSSMEGLSASGQQQLQQQQQQKSTTTMANATAAGMGSYDAMNHTPGTSQPLTYSPAPSQNNSNAGGNNNNNGGFGVSTPSPFSTNPVHYTTLFSSLDINARPFTPSPALSATATSTPMSLQGNNTNNTAASNSIPAHPSTRPFSPSSPQPMMSTTTSGGVAQGNSSRMGTTAGGNASGMTSLAPGVNPGTVPSLTPPSSAFAFTVTAGNTPMMAHYAAQNAATTNAMGGNGGNGNGMNASGNNSGNAAGSNSNMAAPGMMHGGPTSHSGNGNNNNNNNNNSSVMVGGLQGFTNLMPSQILGITDPIGPNVGMDLGYCGNPPVVMPSPMPLSVSPGAGLFSTAPPPPPPPPPPPELQLPDGRPDYIMSPHNWSNPM